MTIAPVTSLQKAIYTRLTDDTDTPADRVPFFTELEGLIDGRVASNPRDDVQFPHVQFGRASVEDDDEECTDVEVVEMQLHVWSRAGGWNEARRIATLIKELLHDEELEFDIDTHALRVLRASRKEEVDDPDGRTVRVIIMIYAEIEDRNV